MKIVLDRYEEGHKRGEVEDVSIMKKTQLMLSRLTPEAGYNLVWDPTENTYKLYSKDMKTLLGNFERIRDAFEFVVFKSNY